MEGIALSLFKEKNAGNPTLVEAKTPAWPLLHEQWKRQRLPYLDYALAQKMLEKSEANEDVAAFICHLSLAARNGHLCIQIADGQITPALSTLWNTKEGEEFSPMLAHEIELLTASISRGASSFSVWSGLPIKQEGNRYYFNRYWTYESSVIEHFQARYLSNPGLMPDLTALEQQLNALVSNSVLLSKQAEAIHTACKQCFTLICGGPGTGKTYTAGHLIHILLENLTEEQRRTFKIIAAAPTGKAASTLHASLSKALGSAFPVPTAQTLHSLLGKSKNRVVHTIDADLILIDESSMIDVQLMARLLQAVKPGARLLLLGDPFQLPPVEAGSIFADLAAVCRTNAALSKHLIELNHCVRTEMKEIVDFAQAINKGDTKKALQLLSMQANENNTRSALHYHSLDASEDIRSLHARIVRRSIDHFPYSLSAETSPVQLLGLFSGFRLLSPLRQGPFGVDQLNDLFLKKLTSLPRNGKPFIAPIMIAANNYRLDLFNGEVGVLVCHDSPYPPYAKGDYALFPARSEGGEARRIPALLLPAFEYAYCLSVHKSQGSEFNHILLLLPEGSQTFGREGIYTAVTRAKRGIELWSRPEVLRSAIESHSQRISGIQERIKYDDVCVAPPGLN